MNKNEYLSLDDFKKWMNTQKEFTPKMEKKFPIGVQVESKINAKKLSSVMVLENGQENRVIKDFLKNGGKITEVNGKEFLIEVTMGSFCINRNYVRQA
jgi:hypothetical protein